MKKQKKYKKKLRYTKRNQNNSYRKRILIDREIKADIVENEDNQNDLDIPNSLENEDNQNDLDIPTINQQNVHRYYDEFAKTEWKGMITIKIFPYSYSKDNYSARSNRKNFLEYLMGNLKSRMKIPNNEFQWIACEEFGIDGIGHLHVLFTFNNLTDGRKNKITINDFSNDGKFNAQLHESASFVAAKLGISPKVMDIDWVSQWENDGLVRYFCKIEHGRVDKLFIPSKYYNKLGLIAA